MKTQKTKTNSWTHSLQIYLCLLYLHWRGGGNCKYIMEHGQKVVSGADQLKSFSKPYMSNIMCAVACQCTTNCDLYHYNTVSNMCVIFSQKASFNPSDDATSDPLWSLGYILQHWRFGAWTVVFRAQSRIGVPVYETWVDTTQQHDRPLSSDFPQACLTLTGYSGCDRHFRSSIVDNWNNIQEVYYSLVKNDVEVAYIVFDGTGSTRMSWFSQSRILHSRWSPRIDSDSLEDGSSDIRGLCGSVTCRRFMMYGTFGPCRGEYFYTFVIDRPYDNCNTKTTNWEIQDLSTFPVFMYAPGTRRGSLGIDRDSSWDFGQEADVLSISVKFGP